VRSVVCVHEGKQGIGFRPCAWVGTPTVMEGNPTTYTFEDKDIGEKMMRTYWNYVYNDSATWIRLSKLVPNIDDKIAQAQKQINNKQNPVKVNTDDYSGSSSKGVKP
jgi:hypothetical protein